MGAATQKTTDETLNKVAHIAGSIRQMDSDSAWDWNWNWNVLGKLQ